MFLYHMGLQRPTGINTAVVGNFSGTKQQEIVVSRMTVLELLRPDPNTGKLVSILTHDVFSTIRSVAAFRLTGESRGTLISPRFSLSFFCAWGCTDSCTACF